MGIRKGGDTGQSDLQESLLKATLIKIAFTILWNRLLYLVQPADSDYELI